MNRFKSLHTILAIYKAMSSNEDSIDMDLKIIESYISQDEVPLDKVIETFTRIMATRAANKDKVINRFRSEGVMPYNYYYKNYPEDVATVLEALTRKIIASMDLTDNDYSRLQEIASKHKLKSPFYVELLEKCHERGIFFVNE